MHRFVNHPFRYIYKFICYDFDFNEGETITDMEDFVAVLKKYPNDKFESYDERFNGKSFTGYKLEPQNSHLASIEIIRLKSLLTEVIGANIRE